MGTPTRTLNALLAIVLTLLMVVTVRELSVFFCNHMGFARAGNIVGLIVMFTGLFTWRIYRLRSNKTALPHWLTQASNTLLIDSGFAFLPVSAGAGILLFSLQSEFWGVVITIIISTLLPLWGLAKIADFWLKTENT